MSICFRFRWLPVLVLLLGSIFWIGSAQATDPVWPQFRGMNSTGVAGATLNPPVKMGPSDNVLWKMDLPSGYSSPCIWGDRIFVTGIETEQKAFQSICIDRNNGKKLWQQTVHVEELERVHKVSSPASATPTSDGELLYVYFASYGVLCYDFAGNEVWELRLPIPPTMNGVGTSPIISNGFVILNRDEAQDPHLLAIDKKTGEVVWKQPQPKVPGMAGFSTCSSTPVVWQDQVIIHRMGEIVGYSVKDGSKIWTVNAMTSGTSTPVVTGDILYVGTWGNFGESDLRVDLADFVTLVSQYDSNKDGLLSLAEFPEDYKIAQRPEIAENDGGQVYLRYVFGMFDANKDDQYDTNEWDSLLDFCAKFSIDHGMVAIRLGGEGNVTASHVLWQETKSVPEVPSPLHYQGRVYMIKNGGIVSCLNDKTGEVIYRGRLGAPGSYYTSPVVANGRIYIASSGGILSVFKAGDELELLAQNDFEEAIYATPAIIGNNIYVRTAGRLYAFSE